MRPRGMTLAEVHKGYRDDGDGDDSLSQREQHQQQAGMPVRRGEVDVMAGAMYFS
eukprot:COSAG01_NODE_55961_length_321_cov_1.518018_1_plen_55_part_00